MYQQLTIVGRLGRNPEMRRLPDGEPVTRFSVATEWRRRGGDDGPLVETTWFQVQTKGMLAEICQEYLQKGNKVLVTGRLRPDPESGGPRLYRRNDGTMGSSYEVVADQVRFLGEKPQEEAS